MNQIEPSFGCTTTSFGALNGLCLEFLGQDGRFTVVLIADDLARAMLTGDLPTLVVERVSVRIARRRSEVPGDVIVFLLKQTEDSRRSECHSRPDTVTRRPKRVSRPIGCRCRAARWVCPTPLLRSGCRGPLYPGQDSAGADPSRNRGQRLWMRRRGLPARWLLPRRKLGDPGHHWAELHPSGSGLGEVHKAMKLKSAQRHPPIGIERTRWL